MDLSIYIKEEVQKSSLETEYARYVKNTHKTLTIFVKCWIDNDLGGYEKVFEVKSLSEIEVFFHQCEPTMGNEYGFKILDIALERHPL